MRYWALVVGLALLLLGGLWLTSDPDSDPLAGRAVDTARQPNIIIDGLQRVTTDAAGQWQSTLLATEARYFEDDDLLHLNAPTLLTRSENDYELTALRAELRHGSQWRLHEDVLITSSSTTAPPVTVRTEFLEYDTLSDIAQTTAPVEIQQADRLYTTAIGMTLNVATQEFELHEQVRSLFFPEP